MKGSFFPVIDFPLDFDKKLDMASSLAKKSLIDEMNMVAEAKWSTYKEETCSDSDDSYHSDDVQITEHGQKEQSALPNTLVHFLEKLKYCKAMYWGFHTVYCFPGMDELCYCPCGKPMKTWRNMFGLTSIKECQGKKNRFSPRGLIEHFESKKEECHYHKIALYFLEQLYTKYHSNHLDHIALYKPLTAEYKEVQYWVARQQLRWVLVFLIATTFLCTDFNMVIFQH